MQRVAIIAGASRGIGRATALMAARQGYKVCINYREDADAARSVGAQCEDHEAPATIFRADVANPQEVAALFMPGLTRYEKRQNSRPSCVWACGFTPATWLCGH